ncbi:MAG TPA: hypothetical protein VK667_14375 [Ktedonobacteraceae bacterium]|nr:hypothetical protein [Ktedonobacteraceae bacterium]
MFNPSEHLLNIGTANKPRMYLENKWRLVWLREQEPDAQITTEMLFLDLDKEVSAEVSEWDENLRKSVKVIKHAKGLVIFKATVTLPSGAIGTGTKMENAAAFSDFLEKAETGSISRALAGLGFGTQFTEDEGEVESGRLADAPVTRPSYDPDKPATQQQCDTANRLQKSLGLAESDFEGMCFGDMATMIRDLNARLQAARKAS